MSAIKIFSYHFIKSMHEDTLSKNRDSKSEYEKYFSRGIYFIL